MQGPRRRIVDVLTLSPPQAGVIVKGWLRTVRTSKQVTFLNVNDGSNLSGLQVVVAEGLPNDEEIRHLGTGSAVAVTGTLVESPAKGQSVELHATAVAVIGKADAD